MTKFIDGIPDGASAGPWTITVVHHEDGVETVSSKKILWDITKYYCYYTLKTRPVKPGRSLSWFHTGKIMLFFSCTVVSGW